MIYISLIYIIIVSFSFYIRLKIMTYTRAYFSSYDDVGAKFLIIRCTERSGDPCGKLGVTIVVNHIQIIFQSHSQRNLSQHHIWQSVAMSNVLVIWHFLSMGSTLESLQCIVLALSLVPTGSLKMCVLVTF